MSEEYKKEFIATFEDLNLFEPLLKAVKEAGYSTPTPIQLEAIPKVMEGCDLLASAQTGTGKTASFILPALHRLSENSENRNRGPQILVLVPTRELAMQVDQETKKYSQHLRKVRSVCLYGGVPYPIQNKLLARPYEILIATPGRLMDQMDRGRIDLSNLEILILDEADRMLDMGFIKPVHDIAEQTPDTRQTLLFSATLSRSILQLSQKLLKDPYRIEIKHDLTAKGQIDQILHYVDDMEHKIRLLDHLLEVNPFEQAIIFTATKRSADKLAHSLSDSGHRAEALHGDMNQRQRAKTIDRLRRGELKILVATDVAARGIDVATITHVFNFDLPMQPEDYIHRIGRTGRAGATGVAFTFSTFKESFFISKIEKLIGQQFTPSTVSGLEPSKKQPSRSDGPRRDNHRGFSGRSNNNKPRFGNKSEGGFGKRSEGGFSKRSEGGFAKRSEGGFSKQSEGGFAKKSEGGFAKRSEGGFKKNPSANRFSQGRKSKVSSYSE